MAARDGMMPRREKRQAAPPPVVDAAVALPKPPGEEIDTRAAAEQKRQAAAEQERQAAADTAAAEQATAEKAKVARTTKRRTETPVEIGITRADQRNYTHDLLVDREVWETYREMQQNLDLDEGFRTSINEMVVALLAAGPQSLPELQKLVSDWQRDDPRANVAQRQRRTHRMRTISPTTLHQHYRRMLWEWERESGVRQNFADVVRALMHFGPSDPEKMVRVVLDFRESKTVTTAPVT